MNYLHWDGRPIPANATTTGTYHMPNGVYALYHANGEVRFLCRVVSGQVQCWLNLAADGRSGHFDEGNTGEAYYADGRMETFSPWDDSPPFRAKVTFEEWRAGVLAKVHRPLPADAPHCMELDLKDLRASCALNFSITPGQVDGETLRIRILALLRRCQFCLPDFAATPAAWSDTLREKCRMREPWVSLLHRQLPLSALDPDGYWEVNWEGLFGWERREPSWLMRTTADFQPPMAELQRLRQLAPLPLEISPPPEAVCSLRWRILACQALCHLGQGDNPLAMARTLYPEASFQPVRLPWSRDPEQLAIWQNEWQSSSGDPQAESRRAELLGHIERMQRWLER